jgi:hypothetical protein
MIVYPADDVCQVGFWIDAVELDGFNDGIEASRPLAACIGAAEQIVFASQDWRLHRSFSGIVRHLEPPVMQVAGQRNPTGQTIADGLRQIAFAADPSERDLEDGLQLVQAGAAYSVRTASLRSGDLPLMLLSMANSAAMRSRSSRAIGEAVS